MTVDDGDQPDPERQRLARSIFEPSSLDAVADAVSVATNEETRVYVERTGNWYRWSLVHPGGMYPLLRVTARFLRTDYHRIVIGARTVADRVFILCRDPDNDQTPDSWAVIHFDGAAEPADVTERIVRALKLH
jgi:hypothetical protein